MAEAAAEAALAASQARDGEGGRTAVLALNLANVRLEAGKYEAALEPAARALALAESGARGVEPLFARLVLGRAELATSGATGAERLKLALADPGLSGMDAQEIYSAAAELGTWAIRQADYETASIAWSAASAWPQGSVFGEAYGVGRSRTWQAASIILGEVGRRGRARIDEDSARDALQHLLEAARALQPLAADEAPNLELTYAQRAYGEALAWRSILSSKLQSDGQDVPELDEAQGDADGYAELGPIDLSRPRCLVRINARPMPEYPSRMADRGNLAGLALRMRFDGQGNVVESQVIARIGEEDFARAVESVAHRWTASRLEESPPNCRMEFTMIAPVTFVLPYG